MDERHGRAALATVSTDESGSSADAHGDAAPTCILRTKNNETLVTTLENADRIAGVEALELRNVRLGQLTTQQFDRLYNGCDSGFHTMRLENCSVSDRFFAFSTERLAQDQVQLTHFAMANCFQLSMTSLISMSALFSASLVTLELSSCKLARQAGIILSQSLQSCKRLRRLLLPDNNLRDGGLRAIVDALKAAASTGSSSDNHTNGGVGLDELDMSRNGISAAGFGALSQVSIRTINVADNAIESIGTFLLTNSTIESLNLAGNCLSEEGVHELVSTLFREQTSLQVLNLRECGLSASGANVLRTALLHSSFCPLRVLYLQQESPWNDDDDDDDGSAAGSPSEPTLEHECFKEIVSTAATKYPHLQVVLNAPPEQSSSNPATASNERDIAAPVLPDALPLVADLKAAARTVVPSRLTASTLQPQLRGSVGAQLTSSDQAATVAKGAAPGQLVPTVRHTQDEVHYSTSHPSAAAQLQHVDVEYIVSKTIECMNHNFEHRLGQFLLKMESQQQEKNTSQVQFLAAKVEACERAIPRFEARLDVLSDRMAAGNAQLVKLQNEFQMQLQQVRQEMITAKAAANATPLHSHHQLAATVSPTTPLSIVMQNQVDELVVSKVRATEQIALGEIHKLRRETNPQAIVDAVSCHLTQFKQEFDANQNNVLCSFTESIVKDSVRLEERMHKMETQIDSLETVIQAEQQASLLALEAISDAFAVDADSGSGNASSSTGPPTPRTSYSAASSSAGTSPPTWPGSGRRR